MWYNHFMKTVRIIILVILAIYLLLALVFIHISLTYRKQLSRSSEALYSLFAGQIELFKLMVNEFNFTFPDGKMLENILATRNFQILNKELSDIKLSADAFAKKAGSSDVKLAQVLSGLEENVTLIRNEVYRYNKLVENLNINKDSLIFALFVVMLRLRPLDKI